MKFSNVNTLIVVLIIEKKYMKTIAVNHNTVDKALKNHKLFEIFLIIK